MTDLQEAIVKLAEANGLTAVETKEGSTGWDYVEAVEGDWLIIAGELCIGRMGLLHNARKVAALPALLEAAELALSELLGDDMDGIWDGTVSELKQAIAKAKGAENE